MASTANTDRSLFREVLGWALPELAGYALAALGAVVAFTIWAAIYTYVWPGKPPATSIETPAPPPASPPQPTTPTTTPTPIVDPDPAPLVAQVPGDRIPEGLPIAGARKLYVYLSNAKIGEDKVGQIEDVLVGNGGKVSFYIVNVGDWFLDTPKDIAVPSQKVTWFKAKDVRNNDTWLPILSMTKADVQNAPKQVFDPAANKWLPAQ